MRILIVDDHALVRSGMNYVVKEGVPDAEVIGPCDSDQGHDYVVHLPAKFVSSFATEHGS